ncbi:MAG: TonB-dependent receptor [Pseudomonadales bacterium]|nr:TonB-dependent receptor [Pseudomonadales bacterium]
MKKGFEMHTLHKKKNLALLIAAASGISSAVYAETNVTDSGADNVETVVIVGKATNTEVSSAELEAYQANDLSDIFRLTPSVSVGGGASGLAQKIYIRGLEDSMINVTVDGAPQTSTLFHHIGRVTIDPALLNEVEVQAGAGEATSGAGAIGGSIRFRTKDINDLLDSDSTSGWRLKASHFSNDGEQYSATVYGRLSDTWGILGYYNLNDLNNAQDGDGEELDGTAANQDLAFFKVSGEIGDNQHLSLSYEKRNEEGEFARWPNWTPAEGAPLNEGKGDRETFVTNYLLTQNDMLNLEVTAYHTQSGFERELFTWRSDITSYGFDVRNSSAFDIHRITYGIDFRDDEVKSGTFDGDSEYKEEGQVLGLYAQVHSYITDALVFSYGLRWDDYEFEQLIENEDGDPLAATDSSKASFNVGFDYNITDELMFSLGYAEASRGKEVSDGFNVWGTTIDPDLKPETVANTEAAIEYSTEDLYAKVAIYRSVIDDVIFDQNSGAVFYENVGTVETQGLEAEVGYRVNADLEVYLGFSSMDAVLDPADGVYSADYGELDLNAYEYGALGTSRGNTWNFNLNYYLTTDVTFGWNVTYVQSLNDLDVLHRSVELGWIDEPQTIDKPAYVVHDVYAEWLPVEHLQVNLAVINLFDKTYRDHSSVGDYTAIPGWEIVSGYNEPGRDVRLSATLIF